eukprot:COSAG06_NODE_6813_length_2765_cov_2.024381_3_plen_103_part_00
MRSQSASADRAGSAPAAVTVSAVPLGQQLDVEAASSCGMVRERVAYVRLSDPVAPVRPARGGVFERMREAEAGRCLLGRRGGAEPIIDPRSAIHLPCMRPPI